MLKGQVAQQTGGDVVLMVGGVGYLVHMPAGTHLNPSGSPDVTVYTMLIVRQDCMDLYGFTDQRQREIFALLLGVSGIGPKTAMNIISSVEPNRFLEEVVSENISYLMNLPGIGSKGAQGTTRPWHAGPPGTLVKMLFQPLSPWVIPRTRPARLSVPSRLTPLKSSFERH
jgi:Holliday junction DNA helicase RuvA subunit